MNALNVYKQGALLDGWACMHCTVEVEHKGHRIWGYLVFVAHRLRARRTHQHVIPRRIDGYVSRTDTTWTWRAKVTEEL